MHNRHLQLGTHRTAAFSAVMVVAVLGLTQALGAESTACPAAGARVFLFASGVVSLNGQVVEVSKLKAALDGLRPKPTVICYSRGSTKGEPPASMVLVLDTIISTRLPIGFYTDGSFEERVELP